MIFLVEFPLFSIALLSASLGCISSQVFWRLCPGFVGTGHTTGWVVKTRLHITFFSMFSRQHYHVYMTWVIGERSQHSAIFSRKHNHTYMPRGLFIGETRLYSTMLSSVDNITMITCQKGSIDHYSITSTQTCKKNHKTKQNKTKKNICFEC